LHDETAFRHPFIEQRLVIKAEAGVLLNKVHINRGPAKHRHSD
jgi:hypothetical protein